MAFTFSSSFQYAHAFIQNIVAVIDAQIEVKEEVETKEGKSDESATIKEEQEDAVKKSEQNDTVKPDQRDLVIRPKKSAETE